MRIIYDDMQEFAEIAIRCNDTARLGKCSHCPFYDRCNRVNPLERHIMFGEIESEAKQ